MEGHWLIYHKTYRFVVSSKRWLASYSSYSLRPYWGGTLQVE